MANLPDLSKSEWIIMNAVWKHSGREGITLAEFYHALDSKVWTIGTVRSFLVRLLNKGYLKTSKCPYGNLYKPAIARSGVVKRAVRDFVKGVLMNDTDPLIQHLVRERRIPKKDAQALGKILSKS